jgi:hypothetical protein
MDNLIIGLDVANKKGVFTASRAIGAYSDVALSVYNFPVAPDLTTLNAVIYVDSGASISVCSAFVQDGTTGVYEATLSLATDAAIEYFATLKPSFSKDLTLVIADGDMLYCNNLIPVKNNPNAVPSSPTPIVTNFVLEAPKDGVYYERRNGAWVAANDPATIVLKNDSGMTVDLQGETPVTIFNDEMSAGQVRVGLLSLIQYLQTRGIL